MPPQRLLNSPVRTITSLSILFFYFLSIPLQAQETSAPIQVKQGEIALITLTLESDIPSVVGKFLDQPIPFFKKNTDEYAAMIGIDLDQKIGLQPLIVTWKKGESTDRREIPIEVVSASFGTETLKLPKAMVDLDPPTLARVEKEQARMKEIFNKSADQRLWEAAFIVPAEGKVAGTFGLRRIMNGQPRNPHTGEDISAPLGTPVLASNGGRVILVGEFYFNGHSVIIDHGLGLFSMYFHLAETTVKEGDVVAKGQAIGSVGQSGRATGPHLHWGVRLNGARVNPFSLIEKKLG
ncbi:MAG: M23 family metallopeptidase [Candidatus Manganitrophus sp.]|nr:M23 family metallopeptidase [Candidatus Manganitrophus sp.]WDT69518.1 MAG: M23 family metallopeptidase [Candidatus Manganitrophus sp.]